MTSQRDRNEGPSTRTLARSLGHRHRRPRPGHRQAQARWHSFAGTKRQAQIECARLISELKSGVSCRPSRETVAEFFDALARPHGRPGVAPHARALWRAVRKNLVAAAGQLTAGQTTAGAYLAAYAKALTSGRRDGQGGLSPRTVHHMHRVLRQALQQALQWQLLARNPADLVKPPKVEREQMQTLDADGTVELIEAARGSRHVRADPARRPLRPAPRAR